MLQVPAWDLFRVVLEISRGTWGTVTARLKVRDQHVPNCLLDTKMFAQGELRSQVIQDLYGL